MRPGRWRRHRSRRRRATRRSLATNEIETVGSTFKVNEKGQQTGMHYVGTQWQNGKEEIIWPAEDATAEIIVPKANWA